MPKANLTADDGEKAGAKTKPKKKKNWLLIMVVLIILAGSSGGAYWYFNKPADEAANAKKKVATKESESLDMGEVVVNLSGGSHYLRVKIVIEHPKDKKLAEELKKKKHTVSDAIITTLRSKTYTEVSAADSAQALKTSIMEEVNNSLESGEITGVYFTDFLVQ